MAAKAPFPVLVLLLLMSSCCLAQYKTTPEQGDCTFYLYQDSLRQCGKKSYLIKFGYKYCNFFLDTYFDKFSEEGQKWALEMGYCLQVKINDLSDTLSCKELKKQARKSHLPCLLESGYLELPKKDQRVYKRLGARNPLNWPSGLYYMRQLRKMSKSH